MPTKPEVDRLSDVLRRALRKFYWKHRANLRSGALDFIPDLARAALRDRAAKPKRRTARAK